MLRCAWRMFTTSVLVIFLLLWQTQWLQEIQEGKRIFHFTGYTTLHYITRKQGKNSRKKPADRDKSKNQENCFTGFLFTTCLACCIIQPWTSHLRTKLPTVRRSFLHQLATNKNPFTIENRPVWWRQFSVEVLFFLVTLGMYQIDSRHFDNPCTDNEIK